MKKTIISRKHILFVILTISILSLRAQISIDKNDMPSPDQTFRLTTGINADFIDYTNTGEDYYWDFSELTSINQITDTFVSQTNVPFLYMLFYAFSSNLAKKQNNEIPIPGFPINNPYTFYSNTNDYFAEVGDAVMLYGIPIPLKYNNPDILYHFPMNYGNIDESYAEYGLGLENYGYLEKKISRTNTVDGWGTLVSPYGTFDVLRIKSEIIEFDSVYIDSLNIGLPLNREYTEYSWLGRDMGVPLLKITSNYGGSIVTYLDSVRLGPSTIGDINIANQSISIYPVPTKDKINIDYKINIQSDVQVDFYNLTGQKITTELLRRGQNRSINLNKIIGKKGTYIMKFRINDHFFTKKVILF